MNKNKINIFIFMGILVYIIVINGFVAGRMVASIQMA